MVPCTQLPPATARGVSKRLRKSGQWKAAAQVGETTPITQRRSSSTKGAVAKCGLANLTQQTPMPQSDPGNEFGPPPPDTTPTPHRELSCDYDLLLWFMLMSEWYLAIVCE